MVDADLNVPADCLLLYKCRAFLLASCIPSRCCIELVQAPPPLQQISRFVELVDEISGVGHVEVDAVSYVEELMNWDQLRL